MIAATVETNNDLWSTAHEEMLAMEQQLKAYNVIAIVLEALMKEEVILECKFS